MSLRYFHLKYRFKIVFAYFLCVLQNLDLTQHKLLHDGLLISKKNPGVQLHGLLFENIMVLLQKLVRIILHYTQLLINLILNTIAVEQTFKHNPIYLS